MLTNNIKIALRNLWRNKQFSIINILGLALGISVFIFITQYIATEWSANRFNKNYDQLYRANVQQKDGNTDYYLAPGVMPLIKQKVTGIDNFVRIADGIGGGVVSTTESTAATDTKAFREENILYVDSSFFSVFTYPLLSGTPSLKEPKTLALSELMSNKLFATTNAVGKVIKVSNQFGNTDYTVTAVYKNMPEQSDIKADILLSLQTLDNPANRNDNDWADPNGVESGFTNIYLQLNKEANPIVVTNNINKLVRSLKTNTGDETVYLQPFANLHLAPSFTYPFQTFGSLVMVTVFSIVALLILLIAWVNYINLSTAQALKRAKEVGVRKVLGASRNQLVLQYLTETFFITLASVLIALSIVTLLQPLFNNFTGKNLSLAVLNNNFFWLGGIVLICFGSLLSGSYVAFVLSSFKPIKTIRGKTETPNQTFSLRKALVVFQFTISIVFIICTIVLYKQLQYMNTQDLGMNLSQLLVVKGPTVSGDNQALKNRSFKTELSQLPFVTKVSASNNIPGQGYNFSANGITKMAALQGDDRKSYSMFIADQNFFNTYGIKFTQGSTFTENDADKSWNNIKKVIINEKAATSLGFKKNENITGQKILWGERQFEVVGVVKDYHHLSLREAIQPTLYLASSSSGYFTVQTDSRDMQTKINAIKKMYNTSFSGNPFDYFFADDLFNQQYKTEQKLGKVFITAACTAIFIACLGLFGLATFTARQRIKEIGIRKVLGASVADITSLISKDFIKLVFVSIVIASPIAWYVMNKWLQDFSYRTNIGVSIFLLAGVIAVFIALATISFQAIKAAIANPVKSLRTE